LFFNINNIFFKFNKYYINNFNYNNIYNTNSSILILIILIITKIIIFIRQIIIFLISILLIIIKIIVFIIQIIIFRNLRPNALGSAHLRRGGLQTRLPVSAARCACLALTPKAWQPQCQVFAACGCG